MQRFQIQQAGRRVLSTASVISTPTTTTISCAGASGQVNKAARIWQQEHPSHAAHTVPSVCTHISYRLTLPNAPGNMEKCWAGASAQSCPGGAQGTCQHMAAEYLCTHITSSSVITDRHTIIMAHLTQQPKWA